MVICLERGADLHMAQRMPLPLTVSWFSKIQIGFSFLVPAHPGSPGQRAVKRVCVCVCVFIVSNCYFVGQVHSGKRKASASLSAPQQQRRCVGIVARKTQSRTASVSTRLSGSDTLNCFFLLFSCFCSCLFVC